MQSIAVSYSSSKPFIITKKNPDVDESVTSFRKFLW